MEKVSSISINLVFPNWMIYGAFVVSILLIIALAIYGLDKRERDLRNWAVIAIVMVIVNLIGFLLVSVHFTKNDDDYWTPILEKIQQTCRLQWDGGVIDAKNGIMTINGFLGNPSMIIPLDSEIEIKLERPGNIYLLNVAKCRGNE